MRRLLGRLIVGFVIILISFISYSPQIFIIWPWYGSTLSIELLAVLLPFNVLVGLLFWNYYLCVVVDPGRVPEGWRPDTHSGDGYEVKKLTGSPRYCRSCEKYKPPRAHHCKQCDRCVLRMDHHCPWTNNCIGHLNYGHFIRFLFFVDAACSYHLAMLTRRVLNYMNVLLWDEPSSSELIFIILNYTFCIPVLLAVGGFSLYHFHALWGNTTTIEGWEKDKVATLVRRGRLEEVKFPYNIGARQNIESVLGSNFWMWCCPTVPPGTGLKFQLADGDAASQPKEEWPPTDPTLINQDDDHVLELPSSPWTYDNASLNPSLQPTAAGRRRQRRAQAAQVDGAQSSLPPYHPDYGSGRVPMSLSSDETDDDDAVYYAEESEPVKPRVRRGSEGYEARPINREEMLSRYIQQQATEVGRYNIYVPEPESESSESEEESTPLVQRVENWRANTESLPRSTAS